MRHLVLAIVLASCSPQAPGVPTASTASGPAAVPVYGYEVVASYPHDTGAFTEGLFIREGALYESTGLEGQSFIRKVDLATGKALQQRDLDKKYFGEGIVAWKDRLIQLTWQSQKGFIYDLATFAPKGEWAYPGEGWALTTDGQRLIMSDGTSQLRFLDPVTLKETGRLDVTLSGAPVEKLNELEWVKGEIWANVFETDRIVRIDPVSGRVTGVIYLGGLLKPSDRNGAQPDVLNGIAYDAAADRIFVTGKLWPKLYEIRLAAPQ